MTKKKLAITMVEIIVEVILVIVVGYLFIDVILRAHMVCYILATNIENSDHSCEEITLDYKEPENPQIFENIKFDAMWGLQDDSDEDRSSVRYTHDEDLILMCSSGSNVLEVGWFELYLSDIEENIYSSELKASFFDSMSDIKMQYALAISTHNILLGASPDDGVLYIANTENFTVHINKTGIKDTSSWAVDFISRDKTTSTYFCLIDKSNSLTIDDVIDFTSRCSLVSEE